MECGIAVDDWKLPIFRRVLEESGFKYEDKGGFSGNCTLLMVETDSTQLLSKAVFKAHSECERSKS